MSHSTISSSSNPSEAMTRSAPSDTLLDAPGTAARSGWKTETAPAPVRAETTLIIRNKLGLHARPATLFVKTAMRFSCEIAISNKRTTASAKSMLGVLTLAASKGSTIHLHAEGEDAGEAIATLAALIEDGLGEA